MLHLERKKKTKQTDRIGSPTRKPSIRSQDLDVLFYFTQRSTHSCYRYASSDLLRSFTGWIFKNLTNLLPRVILRYIWLERNNHIFSHITLIHLSIIHKIDYIIIAWINAVPNSNKVDLKATVSIPKET